MKLQIIKTEDGSHSLYIKELDEVYHSEYGAVNESKHVFINAGLNHLSIEHNEINILEIGFGTGLNAFLTYLYSVKNQIKINYYGIEPYPISSEIYEQLNYPEILEENDSRQIFNKMHSCDFNAIIKISNYLFLNKMKEKLESTKLPLKFFDLVYFDAFAPDINPELWKKDIFENIIIAMKPEGIFVTYSAKGAVRRNLQEVGFNVERIPGPKGKREMLRAIKTKKPKV